MAPKTWSCICQRDVEIFFVFLIFLKPIQWTYVLLVICPSNKDYLFPRNYDSASNIFDIVHVDLWGPYTHHSISVTPYFVTLVDDHSRVTWIFFIKHKSQTPNIISNFINSIQNQYNKTIKCFRTNNGSEFTANACQQLFSNHGILHMKTTPYTYQQNARVERKHKDILNLARSLTFQGNLPLKFWAKAIQTVVYNLNWLPSSVLNWRTPYELLKHKLPDYTFMKSFGYLCFVTNT